VTDNHLNDETHRDFLLGGEILTVENLELDLRLLPAFFSSAKVRLVASTTCHLGPP